MTSVRDDAALARRLAQETGAVLLRVRSAWQPAQDPDARRLRATGDATAHELLADHLRAHRPDDVVFSEEAPDPRQRLTASRVWIIDPLDGTREFGEPGRADWAVHVALWAHGSLVAGAVALPALDEVYATDAPPVLRSGQDVGSGHDVAAEGAEVRPRIAVSRWRAPRLAQPLARRLGGQLVRIGSAGAKAAAVWRGQAEAYLHVGTLHEWDAAAPVVVAQAAGLHVSRLDGDPVRFNLSRPVIPDLLICTPELAEPILTWTARHPHEVIR